MEYPCWSVSGYQVVQIRRIVLMQCTEVECGNFEPDMMLDWQPVKPFPGSAGNELSILIISRFLRKCSARTATSSNLTYLLWFRRPNSTVRNQFKMSNISFYIHLYYVYCMNLIFSNQFLNAFTESALTTLVIYSSVERCRDAVIQFGINRGYQTRPLQHCHL